MNISNTQNHYDTPFTSSALAADARAYRSFQKWAVAPGHWIKLPLTYVDATGSIPAAIILAILIYWFSPAKNGKPRAGRYKNCRLWVAKRKSDWWTEGRITEAQATKALGALKQKGFLEARNTLFGGKRSGEYSLNWVPICAALGIGHGSQSGIQPVASPQTIENSVFETDEKSLSSTEGFNKETEEDSSQSSPISLDDSPETNGQTAGINTARPSCPEEVVQWFTQLGNPEPDATGKKFFAFYEKTNWCLGGEPIRNWRHVASKWNKNGARKPSVTSIDQHGHANTASSHQAFLARIAASKKHKGAVDESIS